MKTDYDVVVVGAGIFGSCTAYNCQKLGLKTLLLEQFELGHKNGSSHGKSRIIRYGHTEVEYIDLVGDSYNQIFELEKIREEKLWKKTGLLWVSTGSEIATIHANLTMKHIEHEIVKGTEIEKRYPQFKFSDEWNGLIDPMGGVIYADKWLNAFREEFKKMGGVIHDREAAVSYGQSGNNLLLTSTKNCYTSKKIIFTVGCWITKLLPNVKFNIEPISISVCYWGAKKSSDNYLLNEDHYPVVIAQELGLERYHYSLPDTDYPGAIKFCYHHGDALTTNLTHPKTQQQICIDRPAQFIQKYMTVIDGTAPKIIDKCIYTNSPDDHYIIGPLPAENPNILVGGCGSGSGFKVAPGIGKALAEMAAGRQTTVDVSFFSADRFKSSSHI